MKAFNSLVKVLFKQQFRGIFVGGKSAKKKRGGIVFIIVLALCLLPLLIGIVMSMYTAGMAMRGDANITSMITFLTVICQGMVLLFGIPSLMSTVFAAKDADRLLILPMSSWKIFLAKLSVVYVNEIITSAIMVLAVLLPFGIGANLFTLHYFVGLLFGMAFIPAMPLFWGCLIAAPLSLLIVKLSKSGIAATIFQLVLFVALMAVYIVVISLLTGNVSGLPEDATPEEMLVYLQKMLSEISANFAQSLRFVFPDWFYGVAMASVALGAFSLNLLYSVGINLLLFFLVVLIAAPMYKGIVSASLESNGQTRKNANSATKEHSYKQRGVISTIMLTDFKRVIRDRQLGMQMLMGVIILPVMLIVFGIILRLNADESVLLQFSETYLFQTVAPLVIFAYLTFLGTSSNVMGIYPISREGKAISVLKSLPIPAAKIMSAKVILATLMLIVDALLAGICAVIFLNIKWYWAILMTIAMGAYLFGIMCITAYLDLKSPRLDWTNFQQGLKNSKGSWLAVLVGLLVSVVVGGMGAIFIIWGINVGEEYIQIVMWVIMICVGILFGWLSHRYLINHSERLYAEIEN
ncbi:MAG: hypothetical protein NC350_01950 [Corallococcus sp.]|nr:hypothetical protein [Corallococcus sp.]